MVLKKTAKIVRDNLTWVLFLLIALLIIFRPTDVDIAEYKSKLDSIETVSASRKILIEISENRASMLREEISILESSLNRSAVSINKLNKENQKLLIYVNKYTPQEAEENIKNDYPDDSLRYKEIMQDLTKGKNAISLIPKYVNRIDLLENKISKQDSLILIKDTIIHKMNIEQEALTLIIDTQKEYNNQLKKIIRKQKWAKRGIALLGIAALIFI